MTMRSIHHTFFAIMPRVKKVIVIGSGMSGLTCANELLARGYYVLVVEARRRPGGRLYGEIADWGGALVHGVIDNPIQVLCDDIGIPTKSVDTTILLDNEGWPIDAKQDQAISLQFNECLEHSFELAAQNKDSKESFGDLFQRVCRERKAPFHSPLFQWHKANLEVSCGKSLEGLGYQWNEDEAYGYEGEHNALSTSWRAVIETLAENVDIIYESPVDSIHVVHPQASSSNSSSSGTQTRSKTNPTPVKKSRPVTPPLAAERQSKRLRGQDANLRRSARSSNPVQAYAPNPEEPQVLKSSKSSKTGPSRTIVQVKLVNGTVLEADAVVCTVPLGVLQSKTITFDPPLPRSKQQAIESLGCGLLNKCILTFDHVFWPDTDFLGLAGTEHSYLVLNAHVYTKKPVLIFMYGGDFAHEIQDWTDHEIVSDCMDVLRRMIGKAKIPRPQEYHVTRWGFEPYSRMAFTYIPPGVEGEPALREISQPIYDSNNEVPVLMFAGEHTTPYFPSTIHGAFLSGIREASRLDIAVSPEANEDGEFSEDIIYERTFEVRRKFGEDNVAKSSRKKTSSAAIKRHHGITGQHRRRGASSMTRARDVPEISNGEDLTPSRRSQRSRVVANDTEEEDEVVDDKDLERLEETLLVKGMDSYNHSYETLYEKVVPIYGKEDKPTLNQLIKKCRSVWRKIRGQKKGKPVDKYWVARVKYPIANGSKKKATNGSNHNPTTASIVKAEKINGASSSPEPSRKSKRAKQQPSRLSASS